MVAEGFPKLPGFFHRPLRSRLVNDTASAGTLRAATVRERLVVAPVPPLAPARRSHREPLTRQLNIIENAALNSALHAVKNEVESLASTISALQYPEGPRL